MGKDGFTDMEEYEYAMQKGLSCSPKDASSHPDYLESLFVDGEMQQTMLPFYLESVMPVPGCRNYKTVWQLKLRAR